MRKFRKGDKTTLPFCAIFFNVDLENDSESRAIFGKLFFRKPSNELLSSGKRIEKNPLSIKKKDRGF